MVCISRLEESRVGARRIDLTASVLILAAVLCIESAAYLIGQRHYMSPLLACGLARIGDSLVVLWGAGIVGRKCDDFENHPTWKYGLRCGVIWTFCIALVVGTFLSILFLAGFNVWSLFRARMPITTDGLFLYFLVGGIISPVAEELVFRGIIFGYLRRYGFLIALFGSTLLFLAAHLSAGGTRPGSISAFQVVGGLLFAWAYDRCGHLLTPIMIHACGNLAIFTLTLIAWQQTWG